MFSKPLLYSLIIVSLIGLLDATYLTAHFYSGEAVTCAVGGIGGCETVTTSRYATVAGLPISLFGMAYYAAVFILAALLLGKQRRVFETIITTLVSIAFLCTLYLVYLQLFVLDAICLYCMASAVITTALFVLVAIQKSRRFQS